MEDTNKKSGKNREMILLIVVAVIGAIGLIALQLARKTPAGLADERSMVQSGAQKTGNAEAKSAPIQRIPGNLVTRDEEYPEVGQPFVFRMTNFSQGAVYELDPGDGSARQVFKDGKLRYTYRKTGEYAISLYAKYEGQEVKLQTIKKRVQVPPKPEQVEIAPFIEN
ncbi:MAG: hypothetical protein EP344_09765 [Bacteroidetes bacterium]|nr:MAG: hypothetical protein EP344_09765 [Bacteroidota bacterium]